MSYPRTRMTPRAGLAATACLLAGLALTLPGCGAEQTTTADGAAAAGSDGVARAAEAEVGPRDALAARRCRRLLGDFLDSIESLANTIAVGQSYEPYLASVNRVRATHAAVPVDRLPLGCLGRVAGPAEGALNLYIDAVNTWGGCLAEPSCEPESVEPQLQRSWERAGNLIAGARSALR